MPRWLPAVVLAAALAHPAAAAPLDLLPKGAGLVVAVERPRRLAETARNLEAYRSAAAALPAVREALDAITPAEPHACSYLLAARLPINVWERQTLLEAETAADRLGLLLRIIRRDIRLAAAAGASVSIERPGSAMSLN